MNLTNAPTANKNETPKPKPTSPVPAAGSAMSYLQSIYQNQANAQKEQLKQNYEQQKAKMEQTQRENTLRTDANLNRTNVESRKDARNYGEIQNAYGLSSGAMAQARLAQDNQRQKDMTLLRLGQQNADANIARDRDLLHNIYLSDQAKVDATVGAAQAQKELENKLAAGQLLASKGDYSILGELYGLTPEQLALLSGANGGGGGYGGGGWSLNSYLKRRNNHGNKDLFGSLTYEQGYNKLKSEGASDKILHDYTRDSVASGNADYKTAHRVSGMYGGKKK